MSVRLVAAVALALIVSPARAEPPKPVLVLQGQPLGNLPGAAAARTISFRSPSSLPSGCPCSTSTGFGGSAIAGDATRARAKTATMRTDMGNPFDVSEASQVLYALG